MTRTASVSLALAFLAMGIAACSSSGLPATTTSTLDATGTVTGSLQLVGGPAPGLDIPAPGVVYAFSSATLAGPPVSQTTAGSDGTFSLNLPAGTYYLGATSPKFVLDPPPATPPCFGDKPAVVTSGGTSSVKIACPMK